MSLFIIINNFIAQVSKHISWLIVFWPIQIIKICCFIKNIMIKSETKFSGLESYQALLKPELAFKHISERNWLGWTNIDFYRALRFTLAFTLITLPIVLVLGLMIALSVNQALQSLRGPIIFVSLLPFVITPVIGALAIRWLFVGDGILSIL